MNETSPIEKPERGEHKGENFQTTWTWRNHDRDERVREEESPIRDNESALIPRQLKSSPTPGQPSDDEHKANVHPKR